ncbi:MAG: HlyD family type I secretion periplasmic adaptor subunit [Aeromonas sp.]
MKINWLKNKLKSDYINPQAVIDDSDQSMKNSILLWVVCVFIILICVWAALANVDVVVRGQGRVIPLSKVQVIQSQDGGVIDNIFVKVGQKITKGQKLLVLNDIQKNSAYQETTERMRALTTHSAVLRALNESVLINDQSDYKNQQMSLDKNIVFDKKEISYPADIQQDPILTINAKNEFDSKFNQLINKVNGLRQQVNEKISMLADCQSESRLLSESYSFSVKELNVTTPLAKDGVVPQVELLKLRRSVNETNRQKQANQSKCKSLEIQIKQAVSDKMNIALEFKSTTQDDLNKAQDELTALSKSSTGLKDRVMRTDIKSPVNGVVKSLSFNTIGGVVKPAETIMEIVPDDRVLLVEADILPKDVAFLKPSLKALIKLTAYDYSKYGSINGTIETIGADSIEDKKGNLFYKVTILMDNSNQKLDIIPGMIANVDIITGKRTVLSYFTSPIVNAMSSSFGE